MTFEKGKRYVVKSSHEFHPNRIGVFEFIGGPDADCVVMHDPFTLNYGKNLGMGKAMFAVGLDDCEEFVEA